MYIYICIHIRYISDMNHFESNGSSWLKKTKSTRLDPRWGRPAISGPIPACCLEMRFSSTVPYHNWLRF